MQDLVLHGYWRSSAAYRLRIAMSLKGLYYRQHTHDQRADAQREASYLALAPQGLVPALQVGAEVFIQSPAILEWLEERHPVPPLPPADADGRARVRAVAAMIACDLHPLNNLRVLTVLRQALEPGPAAVDGWTRRWIGEGFSTLEQMIGHYGGEYAFADAPTLADCCIVPQV